MKICENRDENRDENRILKSFFLRISLEMFANFEKKVWRNVAFLNTIFIAIFADFLENAELHCNSPKICRFFSEKAEFSEHENGQKSDSVIHIPSRL